MFPASYRCFDHAKRTTNGAFEKISYEANSCITKSHIAGNGMPSYEG